MMGNRGKWDNFPITPERHINPKSPITPGHPIFPITPIEA